MDQVQHFNSIVLRHTFNYMVKLSLTSDNTFQTELGFSLNQILLDVVGPEV